MSVKFIFASDSFKGSLTSKRSGEILEKVAKRVFDNPECVPIIVADGGEGTLESVVLAMNGRFVSVKVKNPLFEEITANYGVFNDTAIISMSEASGLPLIPPERRNPRFTTTFGTGELVKRAYESGYRKIIITIGGSATNDGGMGALIALGAKFTLRNGNNAKGCGEELIDVASADFSGIERYKDAEFVILTDVLCPLLGDNGASKVFAKQKGADSETVEFLEKGMANYESVVFFALNRKKEVILGGGGAGGLGFGLKVALGAKMHSGIDYILDLVEFKDKLKGATCVITGEGRIDSQTEKGKVISGIVKLGKEANVPVYAIVGSVGDGAENLYKTGLCGIYSIVNRPDTLENILSDTENLYEKTAESLFYTVKSLIKE